MDACAKLWNRNFLILWLGSVQSTLGDMFLSIGLLWFVLELTGSPIAASTILVLEWLPKLFGPLIGVVVDRVSKRFLMVSSNLVRGIALFLFYAIHQMGLLALWHLYVLVAILGFFAIFYTPAFQVMLPTIVPDDKLPAANAIFQGSQQAAMVIGASLAGVALVTMGTTTALLLDGVSFITAAGLVMLIRFPPEPAQNDKLTVRCLMRDVWAGLNFIRMTSGISLLAAVVFVLNMTLGPVNLIFPVFADTVLGGGVEVFGFLSASIGAGLLIGTLINGVIGDRFAYAETIAFGLVWMVVMFLALSTTTNLSLALLFTAGVGMGAPFVQIPSVSHLQRNVPLELQGRVFATLGSVVAVAVTLSVTLVGRSLVTVAPQTLFYASAAGLALIAIVWIALSVFRRDLVMRALNSAEHDINTI